MKHIIRLALFIIAYGLQDAYALPWVLNNPYPASESGQNIYYSSFSEQPKTLDPARSYSANEYLFIGQIYEPLLEYDYFIRPYKLVPLLADSLPEISYLDSNKKPIAEIDPINPAFTRYLISIKKGVMYQPHPALAKDTHNRYRYHHLA
ncbi:MAG: ABC transporter substrate-binding protein, partial [Legionella sp.]